MKRRSVDIKINPLLYIVWGVLIFIGKTELLLCSFVCAALHEAAHVSAYLYFGASVASVEVLPFGVSVTLGRSSALSCRAEIIGALCGPLMNLVSAAAATALLSVQIAGLKYFIYCNIAFFVLNLLPVVPLDGGRILYFFMLERLSVDMTGRISRIISVVLALLLTAAGIYLAVSTGYNISVLLIAVYLLVCSFGSM